MELKDLYSLQPLRIELEHERRRKYRLQIQAESIVPTLTGMPRGSGAKSKVESFAIKIHDTELTIRKIEKRISELEDFISGTENDYVRCILKLKFMEGYTYQQIASQLGGHRSKESIQKTLYRFFEKK